MAESQYNADSAHNPDPLSMNTGDVGPAGPAVRRPPSQAAALPQFASSIIITSSHS